MANRIKKAVQDGNIAHLESLLSVDTTGLDSKDFVRIHSVCLVFFSPFFLFLLSLSLKETLDFLFFS